MYGERERRAVYERLNDQGESADVDFILLGCPHASLDQIARAARALEGKKLNPGTELWIMTPRALRSRRGPQRIHRDHPAKRAAGC